MITRRKLVTGTLDRKQQESSSKTGTVSSLVPRTQSNYGKVASRNYAEISQKVVNASIPCTGNAQQPMAAPTFLKFFHRDRLDDKMSLLYPNMLLAKIIEIKNHYARVLTKFGEVQ